MKWVCVLLFFCFLSLSEALSALPNGDIQVGDYALLEVISRLEDKIADLETKMAFYEGGNSDSHSFWRLVFQSTHGDRFVFFSEILFFSDTAYTRQIHVTLGTDEAYCAANSTYGPYRCDNAFPDYKTTAVCDHCFAAERFPVELAVKFSRPVSINSVTIVPRLCDSYDFDRFPKDLVLQFSDDGSVFTTKFTYSAPLPSTHAGMPLIPISD